MAKNLKAILSKKNWSGEEVGRALIANLMNDIKCIGKDHEPLFSQGELDTMTNSLSEEQYNNLRPYHRLHSIIHESYNFLQAKHQQFYNGYYRLLNYLKSAEAIEAMRTQAEKYPLILSAEKYDELSRAAYEERRGTVDNLYGAIISHLSQAFLDYLDGDEHLPEEYRAAFEKLKQETATDAAIIKQSDEVSPRGTYVLPTGERSRDYTREEWYELQREAFKHAHGIESEEDLLAFGERFSNLTYNAMNTSFNFNYIRTSCNSIRHTVTFSSINCRIIISQNYFFEIYVAFNLNYIQFRLYTIHFPHTS